MRSIIIISSKARSQKLPDWIGLELISILRISNSICIRGFDLLGCWTNFMSVILLLCIVSYIYYSFTCSTIIYYLIYSSNLIYYLCFLFSMLFILFSALKLITYLFKYIPKHIIYKKLIINQLRWDKIDILNNKYVNFDKLIYNHLKYFSLKILVNSRFWMNWFWL